MFKIYNYSIVYSSKKHCENIHLFSAEENCFRLFLKMKSTFSYGDILLNMAFFCQKIRFLNQHLFRFTC
ncbi:hypothetical protein ASE92_15085 [Pedobacter sp. Leaf41]|nr:hypothetical protein ASE92_15085 [Pedobacter sp. Leaf41]